MMGMPLQDQEVYGAIGEEGFTRLVAAFYRRVRNDDVIGPMYPEDDFDGAERRLQLFLISRFGGPPTYLMERGHPRLRMRHAPFPVDQLARDRWVTLMDQALDEAALPAEAEAVLRSFFHDVATFLMNRGTPAGDA